MELHFYKELPSTNRTAAEVAEVIWQAFEAYCADPVANAHVEIL